MITLNFGLKKCVYEKIGFKTTQIIFTILKFTHSLTK
jgi:hypothetical protein